MTCSKVLKFIGIVMLVTCMALLASIEPSPYAEFVSVLLVYVSVLLIGIVGYNIYLFGNSLDVFVDASLIYNDIKRYGKGGRLKLLKWSYDTAKEIRENNGGLPY